MAGLGRGEDALDARKILRRRKNARLLNCARFHQTVVIQLRERRAHAVVAKTARVVGRRNEAGAERVHLCQRADHAGVAEVIGESAAREARAGRGLDGNDPVVLFAAQLLPHKRRNQTAEVRAAAGAADDDVGLDAVFIERGLRLQTDDRLVKQNLIENAAEDVAVAGRCRCSLDRLADGAAERAGGVRVLLQNFSANVCRVGRRRRDARAVGAHDLAAEGLLLVGAFDHVDPAVQTQVCARHGKRGAPLTGAGLRRDALEPLLLGVIRLGDGGI